MKKIILQQNNKNTSQGFVLLFSIVVSAIIFFIGAGMYSIASKELVISQLTQDSQKSIFAADAGVECGFLVRNAVWGNLNQVNCLGNNVDVKGTVTSKNFTIGFPDNETCVKVTIKNETSNSHYLIYGQGYNKCTQDSNDEWVPVEHLGLTERVYRYPWAYN